MQDDGDEPALKPLEDGRPAESIVAADTNGDEGAAGAAASAHGGDSLDALIILDDDDDLDLEEEGGNAAEMGTVALPPADSQPLFECASTEQLALRDAPGGVSDAALEELDANVPEESLASVPEAELNPQPEDELQRMRELQGHVNKLRKQRSALKLGRSNYCSMFALLSLTPSKYGVPGL